ncbi:hypothetical protein BDW71DRAFT_190664 [Aspergillus fruticulosus]
MAASKSSWPAARRSRLLRATCARLYDYSPLLLSLWRYAHSHLQLYLPAPEYHHVFRTKPALTQHGLPEPFQYGFA